MRKLAADAAAVPLTLFSVLNSTAFGTVTQAISGKVLIEAQADGVVSRYQLPPGASGLTPQEISALLSQLLDLYDAALATGLTGGIGTPDAAVFAWMLGQLQIVRRYGPDFSQPYLRP